MYDIFETSVCSVLKKTEVNSQKKYISYDW